MYPKMSTEIMMLDNTHSKSLPMEMYVFISCVMADGAFGEHEQAFLLSKGFVVLFVLSMIYRVLRRHRVYMDKPLIYPVLFFAFSLLSNFWAVSPTSSFSRTITLFQLFILMFFTYQLFSKHKDIRAYIWSLYLAGFGLAAYSIFTYGFNGIIAGMFSGVRMGGKIANENSFGMTLAYAVLAGIYILINEKRKIHIPFIILLSLLSLSSGSKKALLIIVIGSVMVVLNGYGIRKLFKSIAISSIIIAIIWFLLQQPLFGSINQRFDEFFTRSSYSDRIRSEMIDESIELFRERTWLGYGLEGNAFLNRFNSYSHNNYTEMLVSGGVVGFVLFYCMYYYILKRAVPIFLKGNKVIGFIIILFLVKILMEYGMVSYFSKSTWIMIGVGMAITKNNLHKELRATLT